MLTASAYSLVSLHEILHLTCSIIRTQYTGVGRATIFAVFMSFYVFHQKNV